jgi:hypothetical protein
MDQLIGGREAKPRPPAFWRIPFHHGKKAGDHFRTVLVNRCIKLRLGVLLEDLDGCRQFCDFLVEFSTISSQDYFSVVGNRDKVFLFNLFPPLHQLLTGNVIFLSNELKVCTKQLFGVWVSADPQ